MLTFGDVPLFSSDINQIYCFSSVFHFSKHFYNELWNTARNLTIKGFAMKVINDNRYVTIKRTYFKHETANDFQNERFFP